MEDWTPIKYAPNDGGEYLLFHPDIGEFVGKVNKDGVYTRSDNNPKRELEGVTHFKHIEDEKADKSKKALSK